MPKVFILLLAAVAGIGALLFSRTARGEQSVRPNEPDFVPASGTRGLINNNPFNLKYFNIGWRGETGTDGIFSVFDTAENGIRAGMINIHTKMERDGLRTVRKVITRLSPDFENPTEAFIQFVAKRLNVAPDQAITFRQHIIPMSKAIIQFENGSQPFTDVELQAALQETGKL